MTIRDLIVAHFPNASPERLAMLNPAIMDRPAESFDPQLLLILYNTLNG